MSGLGVTRCDLQHHYKGYPMTTYVFTSLDKKVIISLSKDDKATDKEVFERFKKIQQEYFPAMPYQHWGMEKQS